MRAGPEATERRAARSSPLLGLRSLHLPSQLCGWTICRPCSFRRAEAAWMEAQMPRWRCPTDKMPVWAVACWLHLLKTWRPPCSQRHCRQKEMSGKQRGLSKPNYPLQPWSWLWYIPSPTTWGVARCGHGGASWCTANSSSATKGSPEISHPPQAPSFNLLYMTKFLLTS